VEVNDYEEVRDNKEELLQALRLLEEEDLSLLLEVIGVVFSKGWSWRSRRRQWRFTCSTCNAHPVSVAIIPRQTPEPQEDEEEVQQKEEVHEEDKVLEDEEEPDPGAGISVAGSQFQPQVPNK
jgi:hypothetical protein